MCCIGLICLLKYECLCLLFHLLWYDVLVQYSFVCTCNSWTVSCCLLSCSFIVHTCIPIRCAHIYLSTYLSTDLSIYIDIHACKYMHAWMYVNVCIPLCACIHIYIYERRSFGVYLTLCLVCLFDYFNYFNYFVAPRIEIIK